MNLTVVLVGPTGEGKSATGNTILGREAFISRAHSSRVTQTCEVQSTLLEDGGTISVIDTPGFLYREPELLEEEAKKCIHLARNRIHAILFVISIEQRMSTEDGIDAVGKLKRIFGENIMKYIILVISHGDAEMYYYNWGILHLCQGGHVSFDNKNEEQKSRQVQKLLSKVKELMSNNGGKPFKSRELELQIQAVRDATTRLERLGEAQATTMNAIKEQTTQIIDVVEARLTDTVTTTSLKQQMEAVTMKADERAEKYLKEETSELIQRISKSYEEQMTQRLEAVEQRVLDTATRLEQQLAEAHLAQTRLNEIAQCQKSDLIQQMTQRINEVVSSVKDVTTRLQQQLAEAELKADERAQEAQKNLDDQIQTLKEVLERAESRVKDVTTRLEQQLAEAEATRLKADERAQEAKKNSEEQIQKPYWRFGVKPFIFMFMLILLLLWDQYRQTYSIVK